MKKADRELIFRKFGGRCSYCGCDLTGTKWHADHAEPVERKMKYTEAGWFHKETGEKYIGGNYRIGMSEQEYKSLHSGYEYRERKLIPDGFRKPENDHIDNMMPACASCNINKHSMNIEEFRAFIQHFIISLNRDSTIFKIAKRYNLIEETGNPVVFYFEKIK